jgi:peptidoglycan hydrolase-like protein with peptidoglycan-binding domain
MNHISKTVLVFSLLFSSVIFASTVNATETNESDADIASVCLNIPVRLQYQSKDTSTSKYVMLLQDFLNDAGYLLSQPTGFFGAGTFKAVKAFQKANNISQTGSLGPLTRAKIAEITCGTEIGDADDTPVCNSSQSFVNGVCVTMTRTCPDGRVLAVSRSCDTNAQVPSAPSFTIVGMTSSRVKSVTATENMTMNWNSPSASSYKIKVDMPNGELNDKEFPTTITTWTGNMKDLLGMTTDSVSLYIKACNASGVCGDYSLPVTITVKSSVNTSTQTTATNQVPVVTIKAKPYWGAMPTPGAHYLITWTATNNPSYCTASDGTSRNGETSDWTKSLYWSNQGALPVGVKNIPSTAASYNQVIRLNSEETNSADTYTFKITCTNAHGTSQVASVTAPQATTAIASSIRSAGGDQNCDWTTGMCTPTADIFDPASPSAIFDTKICKNEFIDGVFTSSNVNGPCQSDSEFTLLRNMSRVTYDAPERRNIMAYTTHYLSRPYIGGGLAGVEGGTPRKYGYNVLKSANGKENLLTWMNANPAWVDNASSRIPSQMPVTTITTTSPTSKTVQITWNATNDPIWCVAKGGTDGWSGFKTAPVNGSPVSQTLTVATPGTYTYELYCVNYASSKKMYIPMESVTVTVP